MVSGQNPVDEVVLAMKTRSALTRDKRMDGRATSKEELLLIHIGHHIWRDYKKGRWPEKGALAALEAVWEAKEEIRRPLRQSWLEDAVRKRERMVSHHFPKRNLS